MIFVFLSCVSDPPDATPTTPRRGPAHATLPLVLTASDAVPGGSVTLRLKGVVSSLHTVVIGESAGSTSRNGITFDLSEVQFVELTTDPYGFASAAVPLDVSFAVSDPIRYQVGIIEDGAPRVNRVSKKKVVAAAKEFEEYNILVFLADDLGVDRLPLYDHPADPTADYLATTPHLDALADQGIVFHNFWSLSLCGPSRVALQTGRLSRRTGWGYNADADFDPSSPDDVEMDQGFVTIAELARLSPQMDYSTAYVGKWQLTTPNTPSLTVNGAKLQGWESLYGIPIGVAQWYGDPTVSPDLASLAYDNFWMFENDDASYEHRDEYATTVQADDALDLIRGTIPGLEPPWLLQVAFNAPHEPYHDPPSTLRPAQSTLPDPPTTDNERHRAAIEALDTELGRILAEIDLGDTLVFFTADNGSPGRSHGADEIRSQMKDSLYEGGIRVPFVVAGGPVAVQPVDGSVVRTGALVQMADVFPTIAELVGVKVSDLPSNTTPRTVPLEIDGVSLVGLLRDPIPGDNLGPHETLYADRFLPGGEDPFDCEQRAIRNRRYKLMTDACDPEERELFAYNAYGHAVSVGPEPWAGADQDNALALEAAMVTYLVQFPDEYDSLEWPVNVFQCREDVDTGDTDPDPPRGCR